MGGLSVFGWHAVNLLIHITASFFAYHLTFITTQSPRIKDAHNTQDWRFFSLFVALIFLVHPIQTQAVTYIAQRATSLVTLFYLAAVYWYARARIEQCNKYYVWMMYFVVLGMLTKPIIVTLPLTILLYDILFMKPYPIKRLSWFFTAFLLSLPVAVIPIFLIGKSKFMEIASRGHRIIPQTHYLFTQFNVILTYIRLLFAPINQNLDYDYRIAKTLFEFPTFVSLLAIIAIIFAACWAVRKQRLLSFGILWFFLTLSPQSSLYPLLDVIFEHRVYLAFYGFSIFLCILIFTAIKKRKVFCIVMSCIVAVLAIMTFQRNIMWSDSLVFARDVVKKSPNKARAHNNLGFFYFREEKFPEAKQEYKKALELDVNYFMARHNLGMVYLEENSLEKAKGAFEIVQYLHPSYSESYVGLGHVYFRLNDIESAHRLYKKAIDLDNVNTGAYIGLGNIYQKRGDLEKAQQLFQKTILYDPENIAAHYNLGNIYFSQGNLYDALDSYRRALRIKPDLAKAFHNIGNIFSYLSDYKKAIEYYRKSIELEPTLPEVYLNLANALHVVGDTQQAESFAKKAAELYRFGGQKNVAESIEKKLTHK